jgi:hypothetical protein
VRDVKMYFGWLVIMASYLSTIGCEQLKREESMPAAMTNVEVKKEPIRNIAIIVPILPTILRVIMVRLLRLLSFSASQTEA